MLLTFAHEEWKKHLKPGDRAIDATCGNGHDALVLSKLNLSHLYVFDIQEQAVQATKNRLGPQKKYFLSLRLPFFIFRGKGSH